MNTNFIPLFRLLCALGYQPEKVYFIYQRWFSKFNFIHINKCGGTSIERALGIPVKDHATALERKRKIGRRWDSLYKFGVVRHPYYRVESLYRYRMKTNQNAMQDKRISLDDWIGEVWGERNPEYYDVPKMFAPCYFWLTDQQGNIIVDDVVKLEEIDSHWSRISSRTGINAALERHNQTVSSSSQAALSMSEHNRKVIQSAFEVDFQAFGYNP